MFKCNNCGHVPHEDKGPAANVDATSDPCEECGAEDWVDADD